MTCQSNISEINKNVYLFFAILTEYKKTDECNSWLSFFSKLEILFCKPVKLQFTSMSVPTHIFFHSEFGNMGQRHSSEV